MDHQQAQFIWAHPHTHQRMDYVLLRKEFYLSSNINSGTFHCFANSYYHIWCNGYYLGTGPARSYPEYPEYDSYSLGPYLVPGKNIIAIHALHVGFPTFHSQTVGACFIGWGEVGDLSLATNESWICWVPQAYDHQTPWFSFAIPPIEICDLRNMPIGWQKIEFNSSEWSPAVTVQPPENLGTFRPRSIPILTRGEDPRYGKLLWIRSCSSTYHSLGIRIRVSQDSPQHHQQPFWGFISSYIYSPMNQSVKFFTHWGELFLNGEKIPTTPQPGSYTRYQGVFNLQKGWNFFFAYAKLVLGTWEMDLNIPKSAKVIFSATQQTSEPDTFWVSPALSNLQIDPASLNLPPKNHQEILALAKVWSLIHASTIGISVARRLGWMEFQDDWTPQYCSLPFPWTLPNIPVSLLFDFGSTILGRIRIELTAPRGTVLDIGGAESLVGDRPWFDKMVLVNSGERYILPGGTVCVETFFPRGYRYLQLALSQFDQPIQIHQVAILPQVYPYQNIGTFKTSNEDFNRLWEYGWYTVQQCSEDVITDCPWRERTLYGGDLLPEFATTACVTGDLRLVKRSIEILLQSYSSKTHWLQSMAPMDREREPLFEYPLLTLLAAEWYLRLTHDQGFALRCYPIFHAMIQQLQTMQEQDNLFIPFSTPFIAWLDITKKGKTCATNAIILRSLVAWCQFLDFINRSEEAKKLHPIISQLSLALQRFWDPKRLVFSDAIQSDGSLDPQHHPISYAWVILANAATQQQKDHFEEYMESFLDQFDPNNDSLTFSTYDSFFILGALYECGHIATAERLMDLAYRPMLTSSSGTLWEHFNHDKSLCHGWSSAPTYYGSTRILGVRLGFPETIPSNTIIIAPTTESITEAAGTVYHPCGKIYVHWVIHHNRLYVDYQLLSQHGSPSIVIIPQGKLQNYPVIVCQSTSNKVVVTS